MIETLREQINDQNHNHNHDHITSKNQKKDQIEKLEVIFFCFSAYLISFPPSENYFAIAIYFHEV